MSKLSDMFEILRRIRGRSGPLPASQTKCKTKHSPLALQKGMAFFIEESVKTIQSVLRRNLDEENWERREVAESWSITVPAPRWGLQPTTLAPEIHEETRVGHTPRGVWHFTGVAVSARRKRKSLKARFSQPEHPGHCQTNNVR